MYGKNCNIVDRFTSRNTKDLYIDRISSKASTERCDSDFSLFCSRH